MLRPSSCFAINYLTNCKTQTPDSQLGFCKAAQSLCGSCVRFEMQKIPRREPGKINREGIMTLKETAPVNPAAEREYLIHALRLAAARSRLATNVFDSIGVSLRHRQVTCDQAMEWLRDEGLLDHVQLGPPEPAQ
jgi:hypothetical protein